MRYYFIDTARATLILLGIPYHISMFYNDTYPWLLNSEAADRNYFYIAMFIHIFRMPAFYIAAGFLSAITLTKKTPEDWMKDRVIRLGVPFFFAVILITVPQYLYVASVRDLPIAFNLEGIISHLWFLLVLFQFCLLAYFVQKSGIFPRVFNVNRQPAVIICGLAVCVVTASIAGRVFGEVFDWPILSALSVDKAISYAPFFCLGFMCGRKPSWMPILTGRIWLPGITGAVLAFAYLLLVRDNTLIVKVTSIAVSSLAALALSIALFRAFHRFANGRNKIIDRIVVASFTIYLIHHPIIIVSAHFLEGSFATPYRVLLIAGLTLGLSYCAHRIIASSKLLSFALNGVTARPHPVRGLPSS